MPNLTTYEKIEKYLFTDNDEIESKSKARNDITMSPKEMEILKRARVAFTYWYEKPSLRDSQVMDFIMKEFGVTRTTAYNDMFGVKILLGNVRNVKKEFSRYTVIEMEKEAYDLAKRLEDPKAMAMAADKIGKYTMCDQNQMDEINWDKMIPPNFYPSADISVLDEKLKLKDIEETKRRLREKYKGTETIQEAEILPEDE